MAQRAATLYRRWLPGPVRAGVLRALEGHDRGPLRRAWMLAATGQSPAVRGFTYDRALRGYRAAAYTEKLAGMLGDWHPDTLYAEAWARALATDNVDRALYGDFSTYLPDQLLVKMDVSTMAHSLEARSPLLDVALLEYVATIPTELRLKRYRTKYLLKRLAARYVPPSVIYRRKRGFVMPAAHWLTGELRPVAHGLLRSRAFRDREWVRPAFVERVLAEHQSGRRDWGEQIWTLLVLEIWARLVLDRTLHRSDRLTAEESLASSVA